MTKQPRQLVTTSADIVKHPVDIHVGKRVRQRRWSVGMTQQTLAEQVGIKFQQIQKYETGANRISASRLWDISIALSIGVEHFFEGLRQEQGAASGKEQDMFVDKEAIELLRFYYGMPKNQRRRLFELAQVLGAA
jgi:transcriptional regulator with XRE-family HTH domain